MDAEIIFSLDDNYEFSGRIPTNTEVGKLKASFEFTGTSVSIGDVAQESGTTENDFTNKLTYTVTNADWRYPRLCGGLNQIYRPTNCVPQDRMTLQL